MEREHLLVESAAFLLLAVLLYSLVASRYDVDVPKFLRKLKGRFF